MFENRSQWSSTLCFPSGASSCGASSCACTTAPDKVRIVFVKQLTFNTFEVTIDQCAYPVPITELNPTYGLTTTDGTVSFFVTAINGNRWTVTVGSGVFKLGAVCYAVIVCYGGEGLVSMADGTTKRVADVIPGELVLDADGQPVLVRTNEPMPVSEPVMMVELNGLWITAKHKVRVESGEWVRAESLGTPQWHELSALYNIDVERGVSLRINGLAVRAKVDR